ncbi:MAG: type I glutamate--ammonia ligase [Acidobacteriota bacterium]
MDVNQILEQVKDRNVRFLRLQFTDITGAIKNVEVPRSQFEKALDGQVLFDGSSIEGFVRIEESDMVLKPDLATWGILPWTHQAHGEEVRTARLICDVYMPDGSPFDGCPRNALKRVAARAAERGYLMNVGPEAEFFLFHLDASGRPSLETHDQAGYFDLSPTDQGEAARRDIVHHLEDMGFEIEAAHHEVAPGQHEIDFKYDEAVATADKVITFKWVVRKVAQAHGLHATFMPKPVAGMNGSGMHVHQSLFKDGNNAFADPEGDYQISRLGLSYIGGLLEHAAAICAVSNPLVNSYKRLVPGYEAPTTIAWSRRNRSPLCRVPATRGEGTRVELRMPDPSCNPYLAFAAMLAAGLDGVERGADPGPPLDRNAYDMTDAERSEQGLGQLPGDLGAAVTALEADEVIREALPSHVLEQFLSAKKAEWQDYIAAVHSWETERYLRSM